jgi:hypothetical protein
VTHTAWRFLTQSRLRAARLRYLDVLALLLSALCHDLDHPGLTNAFHVSTRSQLATRYNDVSVNENHHAAVTFELLDAHGVLRGLGAADARAFSKRAVAAILATDMACHKELLARMTACLAAPSACDDEAQQVLVISFVLHCADLCCPLLPPALSRRIAGDLSREFAAQAARERAAGMPVTVMDAPTELAKAKMEVRAGARQAGPPQAHALTAARASARAQLGFLDYVCRPLFAKLVELEPTLHECLARVDANRAMWSAVVSSYGAVPSP